MREHDTGCIRRGDGLRCSCGAADFNAGFEAGGKSRDGEIDYAVARKVAALIERIQRETVERCALAVENTDVVEMGGGYMRQDDGSGTLRAAAASVRALNDKGTGT